VRETDFQRNVEFLRPLYHSKYGIDLRRENRKGDQTVQELDCNKGRDYTLVEIVRIFLVSVILIKTVGLHIH
jgi:hypothetical protein